MFKIVTFQKRLKEKGENGTWVNGKFSRFHVVLTVGLRVIPGRAKGRAHTPKFIKSVKVPSDTAEK